MHLTTLLAHANCKCDIYQDSYGKVLTSCAHAIAVVYQHATSSIHLNHHNKTVSRLALRPWPIALLLNMSQAFACQASSYWLQLDPHSLSYYSQQHNCVMSAGASLNSWAYWDACSTASVPHHLYPVCSGHWAWGEPLQNLKQNEDWTGCVMQWLVKPTTAAGCLSQVWLNLHVRERHVCTLDTWHMPASKGQLAGHASACTLLPAALEEHDHPLCRSTVHICRHQKHNQSQICSCERIAILIIQACCVSVAKIAF